MPVELPKRDAVLLAGQAQSDSCTVRQECRPKPGRCRGRPQGRRCHRAGLGPLKFRVEAAERVGVYEAVLLGVGRAAVPLRVGGETPAQWGGCGTTELQSASISPIGILPVAEALDADPAGFVKA